MFKSSFRYGITYVLIRKYIRVEIKRLLLKSIMMNRYLPKIFSLTSKTRLFLKTTRIRNRCTFSNSTRSVMVKFGLNRFILRMFLRSGKISGFHLYFGR